jgi:hypothetical protein
VTIETIIESFGFLHANYGDRFPALSREKTFVKAQAWHQVLAQLSDESYSTAVLAHCQSSPHPPTPADVLNAAAEIARAEREQDERALSERGWQAADEAFRGERYADMRPVAEFLRRRHYASQDRPDNVGGSIGGDYEPDIDAATQNCVLYGTSVASWVYCRRCHMVMTLDELCDESAAYFVPGSGWQHRHCPIRGTRPMQANHPHEEPAHKPARQRTWHDDV